MSCKFCERSCEHNGYGQTMPRTEKKNEVCPYEKVFHEAQAEVLEEHLDDHAWFRGISDKTKAALDFIKEFAPIQRETMCDMNTCGFRGWCLVEDETVHRKKRRDDHA